MQLIQIKRLRFLFSRRTPSLSPEPQRAGSVPRQQGRDRPRSPKNKVSPEIVSKSKSLPPSKAGEAKNSKKVLSEEEKAQKAAEEKMKVFTYLHIVKKLENYSLRENISSNQLFFSKSVAFTKFSNEKCDSKFP